MNISLLQLIEKGCEKGDWESGVVLVKQHCIYPYDAMGSHRYNFRSGSVVGRNRAEKSYLLSENNNNLFVCFHFQFLI